MEVDERRLEDLVEAEVRLGIIRRMINDEDEEHRSKGYSGSIDTKTLRQIIGMAPWEAD